MAKVKKVILVHEDGTTEEHERFVGAFVDDKGIRVVDKNSTIQEMALIAYRFNKRLDKRMEEITHEEED